MAKSRIHIAHRMPKSLSIDYSNNSENLRPKITSKGVVKSRISVNNSNEIYFTFYEWISKVVTAVCQYAQWVMLWKICKFDNDFYEIVIIIFSMNDCVFDEALLFSFF